MCAGVKHWLAALAAVAMMPAVHAEVVVVAGSGASVGSLSKEQVSDIFLGKSSQMSPIDQPESSPLRDEFYTKVTGKSAAAKAYWSKLAFTGKGIPPKEGANSGDIKKKLSSEAGAIGYIEKSAVDGSVKVLLTVQ